MKTTIRHAAIIGTAAMAALVSGLPFGAAVAADAKTGPVPGMYQAQAQRCANLIREAVPRAEPGTLRHTITSYKDLGNRRQFTIQSELDHGSNAAAEEYTARCMADRWGTGAELVWLRPATS